MNHQWTIGKKLTVSCAAMLTLVLAMSIVSLNSIASLNSELETATQKTALRLQLGGTLDTAGSDMLAGMRGIVMFSFGKAPSRVQMCRQQFDAAAATWQSAIDEVRPLLVTEEGKRLVNQLQQQLITWKSVIIEVEQAALTDPDLAMRTAVLKGLPIYNENTRDTAAFRNLQTSMLNDQRSKAASIHRAGVWSALIFLGLTATAGTVLLVVVRQSSRVLRTSAAELSRASEQVASAAGQISSSSQSLAQGASEQAASLEETSASTEEIATMTRKNAEDARSAAGLMNEASRVVEEANATLEQMQRSMDEINASGESISRIIKVIDEIAFQTNILALNAAVEAARAGDAGMGFAVVADEVRNLAQRSAQAAKDTESMIRESISKSSEGRLKLDHVSRAIRSITDKSLAVKCLIDGLSVSSGEQSRGVEQISQAVTQVERVTQTAAASAEQAAAAGQELNTQSVALNSLVGNLEALVGVSTH
jgi:methyl-accepting chemotaxis protein